MINVVSHTIVGGELDQAGSASARLKEMLKKVGVQPNGMRRAVIAAYEAEMNVVIHARKGLMVICLNTDYVDVTVTDEGPGIVDIDQAMEEGFSTAPSAARELGFGAGMGLPNIKKNSDRFAIHSTAGEGTQLSFTIHLKPQETFGEARHSVQVVDALCRECLRCIRICPTQALRVRGGKPEILGHLCIDCPACIGVCQTGALTMNCRADQHRAVHRSLLIVPSSFLVQFGPKVHPSQVIEWLASLGFRDVRVMDEWVHALRNAAIAYAQKRAESNPLISPVCPAVVNLIETRFPSLIEKLVPFLFAIEAARRGLTGQHIVIVPACPSQRTALIANGEPADVEIIAPSSVRNAVLPSVHACGQPTADISRQTHAQESSAQQILEISGIDHVINVLENAENGQWPEARVLELYACDQGCFGSPLWAEDPFVARHRWFKSTGDSIAPAKAFRRIHPFSARSGMRLDPDMSTAIEKLSKIDELIRSLPGKDCGMCGAPTCSALAEDVVSGRAEVTACVYFVDSKDTGDETRCNC